MAGIPPPKPLNKHQADYDFVKLHNSSSSYLFSVLGKISRGSLHRWKSMLEKAAKDIALDIQEKCKIIFA